MNNKNLEKKLLKWPQSCGYTMSDDTLTLHFTAEAFAKTLALVDQHDLEIGWNMLVKPCEDGYLVYDILVYPQKTSAAYISVDIAKYGEWKASLTDEEDQNLFGHGHSHVNMPTFASAVDVKQQHDEILTKGKGFYLFQIFNKKCQINTFFYDIDKKLFYGTNNVNIIIDSDEEKYGNLNDVEHNKDPFETLDLNGGINESE